MYKKIILGILLAIIFLVTACGSSNSSTEPPVVTTESKQTMNPSEYVDFSIYIMEEYASIMERETAVVEDIMDNVFDASSAETESRYIGMARRGKSDLGKLLERIQKIEPPSVFSEIHFLVEYAISTALDGFECMEKNSLISEYSCGDYFYRSGDYLNRATTKVLELNL